MTSLNHRLETPTKKKPISNIHISTLWVIFVRAEQISDEREGGDGRTDERTDTNSPCVLQEFVPFGAAAQKRNKFLQKMQKTFLQNVHFFLFGHGNFLHFSVSSSPTLPPGPGSSPRTLVSASRPQPPGPGSSPQGPGYSARL